MRSIEHLKNKGIEFEEIHLKEAPKTAEDVERIYGCPLEQVLKTLVFTSDTKPIIAVVPGDKRVDMEKLKKATSKPNLKMANPDEVKNITGYRVGSVSPFGIEKNTLKIADISILEKEKVNIGSGKSEIGIDLKSEEFKKAWDGKIVDIIK